MKILFLNTYYTGGGAAIATRRLLEGLRKYAGIDARLLVAENLPEGTPTYVQSIGHWRGKTAFVLEKMAQLIHLRGQRNHLFRYSPATHSSGVLDHPWVEWAEVIHLHWIQHGFLSLDDLRHIFAFKEKKVLWTLHDLWPITGGCHIPYILDPKEKTTSYCRHYQLKHCEECPLLPKKSKKAVQQWFYKKECFKTSKIHFLGVSHRVVDELKASPLSNNSKISFLANTIDRNLFRPNRSSADLKRRILFVAARPDDPVKGGDIALHLLHHLDQKDPSLKETLLFTCVGSPKDPDFFASSPIPVEYYPHIKQEELVHLYQTSLLTLSTSRYETFGLTLLESIACGTPVMAFDVGGISTIVQNGINGWLLPLLNEEEMAEKITEQIIEQMAEQMAKQILDYLHNPTSISTDKLADSISSFEIQEVLKGYLKILSDPPII